MDPNIHWAFLMWAAGLRTHGSIYIYAEEGILSKLKFKNKDTN